jgi:hypothetical protein
MISAWLLNAAAHKSDQLAADKQAWSLQPARTSVLHSRSLLASKQDTSPLKWVGGKRACTLVAGTQDVALGTVKLLPYQIENNEMGGACNTFGGEERCMQGFGGEPWRNGTTWKTQEKMVG